MKAWDQRPTEEANLFNPAFCGEVLRRAIYSYGVQGGKNFPYPLSFLVLPIVLHKGTRERISPNTREHMHVWLQNNPSVRVGFATRARSLVGYSAESLNFLLATSSISLDDEAALAVSRRPVPVGSINLGDEVGDCLRKGEIVGRWFSRAGSVENVYTMWGVTP